MVAPEEGRPETVTPLDQLVEGSDEWLDELREAERPRRGGRLGRFELLEEIGHGGQGHVFRALQPETGRVIALKRLAAGLFASAASRRRFEREIEVVSSLRHAGIVSVFGVETVDDQPLLAMEWVEGRTLTDWAKDLPPGRKGVRVKLELFLQVCAAVQFAHANGVLHRDLKPSNILVDSRGQCRLVDFGLARRLDAEATNTLGFLGTPAYAPPESFTEGATPLDVRADVYSLGVVLYECLTGLRPFRAPRMAELVAEIEQGRPARPSSLVPGLDRELDAVVLQACAAHKAERYATVHALGEDLRRYLAGRPVQAVAPRVGYVVRKWIGRNRLAFGACCALFLSILVSAAFALRQTQRIRVQRTAAEKAQARAESEAARALLLQTFYSDAVRESVAPLTSAPSRSVDTVLDWCNEHLEERLGDHPNLAAQMCYQLASSFAGIHQFERSTELSQRGLAFLGRADALDPVLHANLEAALGQAQMELGALDDTMETTGAALAAFEAQDSSEAYVARIHLLQVRGEAATLLRNVAEAEASLREAHTLGTTHDLFAASRLSTLMLANVLMGLHEWTEAEELLLGFLEEHGTDPPDLLSGSAAGQLAMNYWQQLRMEEALRFGKRSVEDLRLIGDPSALDSYLVTLGRIHLSAGQFEEAQAVFEEAGKLASNPGVAVWPSIGRARCALALGDADKAARIFHDEAFPAMAQVTWLHAKDQLEARLCALSAYVATERFEEAEALYVALSKQLRTAADEGVFPDPKLLENAKGSVELLGYETEFAELLTDLVAVAKARFPVKYEPMAVLTR